MSEPQIIELPQICRSFPEIQSGEIDRDGLVGTLTAWLDEEIELVIVDGEPNIGKTTLLSQFARTHPRHTISLFIRPSSRWSFDPEILRFDLANQIEWILSDKELDNETSIDAGQLRKLFLRLQKKSRASTTRYYFVLDGLGNIPQDEESIRTDILNLLPFGISPFRFLISGDSSLLPSKRLSGIPHKVWTIPLFGSPETTEYLSGLVSSESIREQLHRITKGIPGRLASVRRIIKGGTTAETLLASAPKCLPELFELEWTPADLSNTVEKHALSILAHDESEHTIDQLAKLTKSDPKVIQGMLDKLSFLQQDPSSRAIHFVHQSFRDFAAQRLESTRSETIDSLIEKALAIPDAPESAAHLPRLLKKRERFSELVTYLSPERITLMASRESSWGPLLNRIRLAIEAAAESRSFHAALRFSLNNATIQEIDTASPLKSEIEAHLALGDNEAALGLATQPTRREDRLQLLILIARAKRREGLSPEPELLDTIESIFNDLEIVSNDKALAIAADLVNVSPDLAIKLMQKVESAADRPKEIEWAPQNKSESSDGTSPQPVRGAMRTARASIVKKLMSEIAIGMRGTDAEQAISGSKGIDSSEDRLLLLRQWILVNRQRADSLSVTQQALDLIIRVPELSANATTAREICASLPFANDHEKVKTIIAQLDAQSGIFRKLGPSEDFVAFQLLLAEAQTGYDLGASRSRAVDTYLFVCDIKDTSIRANCLGRLVSALPRIDREGLLASKEQLPQVILAEFEEEVKNLLTSTGDHEAIFCNLANTLAYSDAIRARELAKKLNTEFRRDAALEAAVIGVLARNSPSIDVADLIDLTSSIEGNGALGRALISIFENLNYDSDPPKGSDRLPELISKCDAINDAEDRIRAQSNALLLATTLGMDPASFRSVLIEKIGAGWKELDAGWRKSYVGFSLTKLLAKQYPGEARVILEQTRKHTASVTTISPGVTQDLRYSLLLTIRAYGGLLERRNDSPEDVRITKEMIERVPTPGEQAELLSNLALRMYRSGRKDESKKIVLDSIKPILTSLPAGNRSYREHVIANCAAALYTAHPTTAIETISGLLPTARDRALCQVCGFLEYQLPFDEPAEEEPQRFLTFEELTELCTLIGLMREDMLIYSEIHRISKNISDHRDKYTENHIAEILRRLHEIIDANLPAPAYIRHDGYKICCLALLGWIKSHSSNVWSNYLERATKIPNTADKCFVLAVLSATLPSRERELQEKVVALIFEAIPLIPAVSEQARIYEWTAGQFIEKDLSLAQRAIRMAINIHANSEEKDRDLLRNLIDLAHKISPEFAEEVAGICESDPAKKSARYAKDRLKYIEQCKSLADDSKKRQPTHISTLSQAAWKNLGQLNTKRLRTVPARHALAFIKDASQSPLSEAYPVYAWAIENAIIRYSNTDQAPTNLRPIFLSCVTATRLIFQIISSSPAMTKSSQAGEEKKYASSTVISDGDREKALTLIQAWTKRINADWLVVCDPYFGPDELEFAKLIRDSNFRGKITILTSRQYLQKSKTSLPWEDAFRNAWKKISDMDPGQLEVIVCGGASTGRLPVHSRWILTESSGLGIDTSLNTLGVGKTSEMRTLTNDESLARFQEIQYLLDRVPAMRDNERLEYSTFSL